MFKHESFEIERENEYNVNLYQWRMSEEQIKGKKTGKKRRKRFLVGHYGGFRQAFNGLINRKAEDAQDVTELRKIIAGLQVKFEVEVNRGTN